MKIHETAFHVINCHVPVCHAVVPSRKWTMWLFRYVIVISYKCSITSTEVAPLWTTRAIFFGFLLTYETLTLFLEGVIAEDKAEADSNVVCVCFDYHRK